MERDIVLAWHIENIRVVTSNEKRLHPAKHFLDRAMASGAEAVTESQARGHVAMLSAWLGIKPRALRRDRVKGWAKE